ncbi:MAG TPA: dynamin family protein [Syntrophomonadaceae bacterium]|nr:dynamin family protein [Syntrophomonadaceae bacterium]
MDSMEAILDRISYDYEEISQDILNILQDFLQFRLDRKIKAAIGADFMDKIQSWDVSIKRRLNDDFSIVVIGDFKRGKSTLINAILGENVVTTNVAPETVTINRIAYGETYSAEAVLKDGRRARLQTDELGRDRLDPIITQLPAPIEYIDIKAPVDTLKGIRIVDTPGVGDLLNHFDQQVKDYLVYADAVIYVVSALSPLSETEQTFLCASIVPQNFSKLIVILNLVDCLESEQDVDRLKQMINSKLANIFPNSYVYALSGLDEYCLKKGLPRPNPALAEVLEKSFDAMYQTLQNDIVMQREYIQSERSLNMLKQMMREIEGRVGLIEGMITLNQSKLEELIVQYRNENSDLMKKIQQHKQSVRLEIRDMQSEARGWMDEFLSRLEQEVAGLKNSPLDTVEKHLHFFMIDTIRDGILACTNEHLRKIVKLLKGTSERMAEDFSGLTMSSSSAQIANSMVDVSWTNLDAVGAILSFLPIGALAYIGQAIVGFSKRSDTTERQKAYINGVLSNFPQITDSVMLELVKVYENISLFAEEQMDKIYKSQMEASLDAIKQAQDITIKEGIDKEDILTGLEAAKQIVAEANVKIAKYQDMSLPLGEERE